MTPAGGRRKSLCGKCYSGFIFNMGRWTNYIEWIFPNLTNRRSSCRVIHVSNDETTNIPIYFSKIEKPYRSNELSKRYNM